MTNSESAAGPPVVVLELAGDESNVLHDSRSGHGDPAVAPGTRSGRPVFGADLISTAVADGQWEVALTVVHQGGSPVRARIRCDVQVPAGADEVPFWLIPGLFYGENRPDGCDRVFPSFRPGKCDPVGLVSDRWMFRADRAATPAVFAFTGAGGVAVVAAESSLLGMTGVGFAHTTTGSHVSLCFPYLEEPASYVGAAAGVTPLREDHQWLPGERVVLRFTVHLLPPGRHGYAPVLRAIRAESSTSGTVRPWVTVPEAAELAAWGLFRWHYRPEHHALFETAAFERNLDGSPNQELSRDRPEMHVAWLSGIPSAAALLRHGRRVGNEEYVAAGVDVIDTICRNPAPCGSFWGRWSLPHGWTQSWTPVPDGLHARTLAEAALFLFRALEAERATGNDHPSWSGAALGTVELVRRNQNPAGDPGSLYHAITGDALSRAGAAGLAWIPAMLAAAGQERQDEWVERAEAAGRYYAPMVQAEFLGGAPEDVDLAPSSEDGYVASMAYQALFDATGDAGWLDLARRSADWALTFRYSYNTRFPEHTILGRYGFASRGADQASPSNQHLHSYGLICSREMAQLSRATGDPHYAEQAALALACWRQFIAREDGDFNARRGMISERYFQTECFAPKGMLLPLSHAWCAGLLLLAAEDAIGFPELLIA